VTLNSADWCVLQYHLPDTDEGLLVAFRRHASPYGSFDCEVRQIDATADYEITSSQTCEPPAAPQPITGSDLQHLRLQIDTRPGSVIVEYRRVRR
jgi:hypothetical protein